MLTTRNACNTLTLTARAPAKLIISGEHSVLHGQPAIAMAVDRYTTTTTAWRESPNIHFKLLDLAYAKAHTLQALRKVAQNLQHEYSNFLSGKTSIRNVIKRPFELLQYSVANLFDYLNVALPNGMEITVDSSIPIGCGMGSSAAAVVSTLCSLTNFLQVNWQPADYVAFSKDIENLQHGRSSGLDLHLVTYGGCVRFADGKAQATPAPQFAMYLVNTGKPASSTGECVMHASTMLKDQILANEFGGVTKHIQQAIINNDQNEFMRGIKINHKLLQQVGVVPAAVANFITAIENVGGAAKICGAGAVSGDKAGIVLLIGDQNIGRVVAKYGYSLQRIQVDNYGTRVV